jgi:hypothetical protein
MGKPAWEQAKSSLDEITAALLNRSASAAMLGEWSVWRRDNLIDSVTSWLIEDVTYLSLPHARL